MHQRLSQIAQSVLEHVSIARTWPSTVARGLTYVGHLEGNSRCCNTRREAALSRSTVARSRAMPMCSNAQRGGVAAASVANALPCRSDILACHLPVAAQVANIVGVGERERLRLQLRAQKREQPLGDGSRLRAPVGCHGMRS